MVCKKIYKNIKIPLIRAFAHLYFRTWLWTFHTYNYVLVYTVQTIISLSQYMDTMGVLYIVHVKLLVDPMWKDTI